MDCSTPYPQPNHSVDPSSVWGHSMLTLYRKTQPFLLMSQSYRGEKQRWRVGRVNHRKLLCSWSLGQRV